MRRRFSLGPAAFLATVALLTVVPAHATSALDACWESAANRVELGACLREREAEVETALAAAYEAAQGAQAALDRVTGGRQASRALARAQQAFLLYRDLECHVRELQAGSGSGSGDFFLGCWIDMTRARVAALETLLPAEAAAAASETAASAAGALAGTRWLAEDIEGRGVMDSLQSTLAFEAEGRVVGNAGCNRFFGTATIAGEKIGFGPLGATRMACQPAVDDQEQRFLAALGKAASYAVKDGLLFISDAEGRPLLRFSRME